MSAALSSFSSHTFLRYIGMCKSRRWLKFRLNKLHLRFQLFCPVSHGFEAMENVSEISCGKKKWSVITDKFIKSTGCISTAFSSFSSHTFPREMMSSLSGVCESRRWLKFRLNKLHCHVRFQIVQLHMDLRQWGMCVIYHVAEKNEKCWLAKGP